MKIENPFQDPDSITNILARVIDDHEAGGDAEAARALKVITEALAIRRNPDLMARVKAMATRQREAAEQSGKE